MSSWTLESVGTKGYGGGGSYLCARAAKSFLKRKKEADAENYDGVGVFRDPLLDSVYGQCSSTTRPSTTRPQRQSAKHPASTLSLQTARMAISSLAALSQLEEGVPLKVPRRRSAPLYFPAK